MESKDLLKIKIEAGKICICFDEPITEIKLDILQAYQVKKALETGINKITIRYKAN